jgi:hypothetical protein
MEPVGGLPLVALAAMLVVFFSGLSLAARMSAFDLAGPKAAIGTILLMAPLGAVSGKRVRAIRQACADAKALKRELLGRLQDPFLNLWLGIRVAVFLGIILLMAARPGLWESVSVVVASFAIGLLPSLLARRCNELSSLPSTKLGS